MLFTTNWLSEQFTDYRGDAKILIEIEAVNTDSRVQLKKSLFVPIVGDNFDGHDYVKQAINNGAVAVLWEKGRSLPAFIPTDFPVFFVEDTLTGLQLLATNYREYVNPIVIGITGSNGKTTTKDLVAAMMKSTYITHYTDGNFNNHIGLPLTILSMEKNTEVLVLEMGMSGFGEIDLLSKIAKPDYAIITNIGESHIEYLGSREGIAKAKLEIINGLKNDGVLIIDGDEPLLTQHNNYPNTIACGFNVENDIVISDVKISLEVTSFVLSDSTDYDVPLLGKHHAKNATYAIILGEQLGIDLNKRKKALLDLEQTSMRFELMNGRHDVSIVNDAYNASPTSMKAAIEVVKQMKGFKNKILVLGDVLELGEHSEQMHQSIADVIHSPITAVYTYGNYSKAISTAVLKKNEKIECNHFTEKDALLQALEPYLEKETILLFKASRGLQFETLIKEILN
ncbi:UDP-N-acetylmuramoyl-tripeptide--D-alanyl-D-alanine ligase [Oceanobacillus chungangensis]|uniref:UDP-N-acetylmuramoyl-tripeptide--D-alanyl-D-alanine ligase n=1 Tax=Oceanobacillus chungangensis TaxID=1229152 RepID=A0A3D8PQT2_9BACI|nr:UDP-N-acetylmuramoyl-tripeptide--D-alanyl-D-alanine ligase [Oceanobacillus chungangensis]RDW17927.1 UDP-N-acetylmuramoyl-tripeptide--D-alanyl-D-alanine ligase [Oceanobacillus chungangensis]